MYIAILTGQKISTKARETESWRNAGQIQTSVSHITPHRTALCLEVAHSFDRINVFLRCWAVSFPTNIVDWGITLVSRLMGTKFCWSCTLRPLFNVPLLSCTCINRNLYTRLHQASAICWIWTCDSESCPSSDVSAEKSLMHQGGLQIFHQPHCKSRQMAKKAAYNLLRDRLC